MDALHVTLINVSSATTTMQPAVSVLGHLVALCEGMNPPTELGASESYWVHFVTSNFTASSQMRITLSTKDGNDTRMFELPMQFLPRYFITHNGSGIVRVMVALNSVREFQLPNGHIVAEANETCITHYYEDGVRVLIEGQLRAVFAVVKAGEQGQSADLKVELLDILVKSHEECINREQLANMITDLPSPVTNEFGVPIRLMRALEIADVVNCMEDLINHSLRTGITPSKSLQVMAMALLQSPHQNNTLRTNSAIDLPPVTPKTLGYNLEGVLQQPMLMYGLPGNTNASNQQILLPKTQGSMPLTPNMSTSQPLVNGRPAAPLVETIAKTEPAAPERSNCSKRELEAPRVRTKNTKRKTSNGSSSTKPEM